MTNPFDIWNSLKKEIHQRKQVPYFSEREIWWCSTGQNVGFEQNGKNKYFERPVLIIKKFNKQLFWAVPLTTKVKKRYYQYQYRFQQKKLGAIINQLRLYDVKRLQRRMHMMNKNDFKSIRNKLKEWL